MSNIEENIYATEQILGQILELSEQKSGLEMFTAYLDQTKITYLDQHRLYGVVKVSYLEQLEKIAKEAEGKIVGIQQKINDELSHRSMAKQMILEKNSRIEDLEKKLKQSEKSNKQLLQFIEQEGNKTFESQNKYYETQVKSQILELKLKEARNLFEKSRTIKESVQVQTDLQYSHLLLDPEQFEIQVVPDASDMRKQLRLKQVEIENISHFAAEGSEEENHEQNQFNLLKRNFQTAIQKIMKELDQKGDELNSLTLQIETWEEENARIKEQNQNLKNQLREIDRAEEQMKIWNEKVGVLMKKIDNDVEVSNKQRIAAPEDDNDERVNANINFVAEGRIKILEEFILQQKAERLNREDKLKEIKRMMDEMSSMPEENVITGIVQMSEKIKSCVQYLLETCA